MSGHPERHGIFYAALAFLLLLNIGVWIFQDAPSREQAVSVEVPYRIDHWQGRDVELSHNELALLAPARITSRSYQSGDSQIPVWLNVIQSSSMGKLHNFFDSLVASGTRPRILKTLIIQTGKGPLRTSLIRYFNRQGRPYYLLLWYQWPGGTAENRWQWYANVLKLRLQRRIPSWQLVEIATPVDQREEDLSNSPDLKRLEQFARRFYEITYLQNPPPTEKKAQDLQKPDDTLPPP